MEPRERHISIKENLASFRGEIQDLKEKEEAETRREFKTAYFEEVGVKDLTNEDMKMWERYKDKALTREDFEKYRVSVSRGDNKSRQYFVGFLANKLTPEWLKKRA